MPDFMVSVSDTQLKALESDIIDVQGWIENVLHNKARKCINRIVKKHSVYQTEKLSAAEKEQIVLNAEIETAAERQAKFEAEFQDKKAIS